MGLSRLDRPPPCSSKPCRRKDRHPCRGRRRLPSSWLRNVREMPPSLKETNPAPPYNTPTASASGAARHQPANMTRPARHVPWAFFFAPRRKPRLLRIAFYALHIKKANPAPRICASAVPSWLVPRGKPRKDPRRYRRKRKLPRPKRLPPKAATRRGERRAGAGASLRASALPCVSPPGNFVRREHDTWTGRAPVLRLCLEQARSCSRPAGVLNGLTYFHCKRK